MNNSQYEIGPSNPNTGELFSLVLPTANSDVDVPRIKLGTEQLEVLIDAAKREDELRGFGVRQELIGEKVQLGRHMARLAARGFNIDGMERPRQPVAPASRDTSEYDDARMAAAHDRKERE